MEKKWISNPNEFDNIDPEIKMGLIGILEIEGKKAEKDELKARAEQKMAEMRGKLR